MRIEQIKVIGVGILLLLIMSMGKSFSQDRSKETISSNIRKTLETLPYYGMFDHLVFQFEDDEVTLGGYVYQPNLKKIAEREISHIKGINKVDNQIELLPISTNDNRIRMSVFDAIYRSQELSGYGLGGEIWQIFSQYAQKYLYFSREPLGVYPIHIIVKHGNVILIGLVNSAQDKNLAGLKASGVSGVFSVTNNLKVDQKMIQQ